MKLIIAFTMFILISLCFPPLMMSIDCADKRPEGFVDIKDVISDIQVDIRYFTPHNFVGEQVNGYNAAKCIISREAAQALALVQKDLSTFSLGLKVYDCYRPQRAVNHFVKWATEIYNTKTQKEFYPIIDKRNLFRDGYIDSKSGHSRGSTVDLTIIPIPPGQQHNYLSGQTLYECYLPVGQRFEDNSIDMGTGFDCFHELSNTPNKNVGIQQRINRLLLKTLMEKQGFRNFEKEWWHYTLNNEPYPDTYFNFTIE
jgi:zinc D-Ala-D-Ala dipeptidase